MFVDLLELTFLKIKVLQGIFPLRIINKQKKDKTSFMPTQETILSFPQSLHYYTVFWPHLTLHTHTHT